MTHLSFCLFLSKTILPILVKIKDILALARNSDWGVLAQGRTFCLYWSLVLNSAVTSSVVYHYSDCEKSVYTRLRGVLMVNASALLVVTIYIFTGRSGPTEASYYVWPAWGYSNKNSVKMLQSISCIVISLLSWETSEPGPVNATGMQSGFVIHWKKNCVWGGVVKSTPLARPRELSLFSDLPHVLWAGYL